MFSKKNARKTGKSSCLSVNYGRASRSYPQKPATETFDTFWKKHGETPADHIPKNRQLKHNYNRKLGTYTKPADHIPKNRQLKQYNALATKVNLWPADHIPKNRQLKLVR